MKTEEIGDEFVPHDSFWYKIMPAVFALLLGAVSSGTYMYGKFEKKLADAQQVLRAKDSIIQSQKEQIEKLKPDEVDESAEQNSPKPRRQLRLHEGRSYPATFIF